MRQLIAASRRPLALLAGALVCAACGNNPSVAHSAVPAAAPSGSGVATGAGPGIATGATTPGGTPIGSPRATAAPSPTTVGAPRHAGAADPTAAAPGTYPISGSFTTTSTTQPTPSRTAGSGTLTVAAPQPTSAGTEQDVTYNFGSDDLLTHEIFAADGSMRISRSGSASFTPPLPIVPAGLRDGLSWGPVSFTSGSATGTLTGSAGRSLQRSVGGVSVTVVPIKLHLELSGTYHGTRYTATSDENTEWAPSLHLAVHTLMVTDAQYAAAARYHSELDVTVVSARPR
jgi:hypothetical protein